MESFYIYLDTDTRMKFQSYEAAKRAFDLRVNDGLFCLLVTEVGSESIVETTWFEGAQRYTETQFTKLLQSL